MAPRIVVIGAVAAGSKAACRAKRLLPQADVIMVDQAEVVSYDRCGLPYYLSGDVSDLKDLESATYMVRRDDAFFADTKGVEVRRRTRAAAIDREGGIVRLEDLDRGREYDLPYDYLVLATGSTPVRLEIPGAELPGVVTVYTPLQAAAVKDSIARGQVEGVAVIGGGAWGLALAEAAADLWGLETAVVETAPQLLPEVLDPVMAAMVQAHLEAQGVAVHTGEAVTGITAEDGVVTGVATSGRTLPADLVITALGSRPRVRLAREAGLAVGATGGIGVNARLQTDDPRIYAGGDCVEQVHLVSGEKVWFPSGAVASRQGRVIGTNLAGGQESFPGVVGTQILKVFDLAVGATGLTLAAARRAGFDAVSVLVSQADRAHFYPGQEMMCLQLVVDRPSRRVLGLQGVGPLNDGVKARLDAVAALLPFKPTLADLANLEVAAAPPFAAAVDILNTVAHVADNTVAGRNRVLPAEEFPDLWEWRESEPVIFIDTREPDNAAALVRRSPGQWLNIPQGQLRRRLAEVPHGRPLVLICNSGLRSYEAQIVLDAVGVTDTRNLAGGLVAVKKAGLDLLSAPAEEE